MFSTRLKPRTRRVSHAAGMLFVLLTLIVSAIGPLPGAARASQAPPIKLLAPCVGTDAEGRRVATFGYEYAGDSPVSIPIQPRDNYFHPAPKERGQPTTFYPGQHPNVFSVTFPTPFLEWRLGDQAAQATEGSPPCSEPANQPPSISIEAPAADTALRAGPVVVSGSVGDPEGQIASVKVNEVAATISGGSFQATLTLGGGNHTIHAVVVDGAGATAFASAIVSIDASGPQISIVSPADRQAVYSQTPAVSLRFADGASPVDPASLQAAFVDASGASIPVAFSAADASGATGAPASPLAADSVYTLRVDLADTLGNASTAEARLYVPLDPSTITPPAEPEQAARVSGVVYSSADPAGAPCDPQLNSCVGLAGATVTLEPDEAPGSPLAGTLVTGPDGFFSFPVVESGVYRLRIEKKGYTYAQRRVRLVRERSTAASPIFLTPLDERVTECDSAGCSHQNSDDSIRLEIPAGAIAAGDVVPVRATWFDHVEFLPGGELPPGTWETYAFNLSGDSEVTFAAPVTVRIRNTRGFAAGTRIPLGYWNQSTMQWEHSGTGEVDAAGQWVVMQVTHFSNYDCNDPIAEMQARLRARPVGSPTKACDAGPEDGEECDVDPRTGELDEEVDLPPVTTPEGQQQPELDYDPGRADPSPEIDIDPELDEIQDNVELGDHITWELYIEGEKTATYSIAADLENGEIGRLRYIWDGRDALGNRLPAGLYNYRVRLGVPYRGEYCYAQDGIFGNPPDCENGSTGIFVDAYDYTDVFGSVVIEEDGSFGEGWAMAGAQRLYRNDLGQILITDGERQDQFVELTASDLTPPGQYDLAQPPVLVPSDSLAGLAPPQAAAEDDILPDAEQPGGESGVADPDAEQPITTLSGEQSLVVSGSITGDATWEGGPYVLGGDVIVQVGATLRIMPGTVVQAGSNGHDLIVRGALLAEGSAEAPIIFTSSRATPASGNWGGITFEAGHRSTALRHTIVEYSTYGVQINVSDNTPSMLVEQNQLRHNGHGLRFTFASRGSTLTIADNQFSNNGYGSSGFPNTGSAAVGINFQSAGGTVVARGNSVSGNRVNGARIFGTVAGNLQLDWAAQPDMPLVIAESANLTVNSGAGLSLTAGSIVKGSSSSYTLIVNGSLTAEGSAEAPIIFTTLADDANGGDTNNNGPSSGVRGTWAGLRFRTGSQGNLLRQIKIFYASHGLQINEVGSDFGLLLEQSEIQTNTVGVAILALGLRSDVRLHNNNLLNNLQYGVDIKGTSASARIQFSGNSIVGNGNRGMFILLTTPGVFLELLDNDFQNNNIEAVHLSFGTMGGGEIIGRGNTAGGHSLHNGVRLGSGIPGTASIEWRGPAPLVMTSRWQITGELTLLPGTIIKGGSFDVRGRLIAEGTASEPIIFTSLKDDSYGNDTDGASATPAGGDWNGLLFYFDSGPSSLSRVVIAYADRAIYAQRVTLDVSSSYLHSSNTGVYIYKGILEGGQITLTANNISNNTSGLTFSSLTNETFDASGNYWGHPSGPYHITLNPAGQGNPVSGNVQIAPWMTSAEERVIRSLTPDDTSRLEYDANDSTYTRIYPGGRTVHFNVDGSHDYTLERGGQRTVYTYHPDGAPATMAIYPPGAASPAWTWTFNYEGGQLDSITDPAGGVTDITIDEHDRLTQVIAPDGTSRQFAYDERGLLTHQTNPAGAVTSYSYDSYGRVRSATQPMRPVFDQASGQLTLLQPTRQFTPSASAYPLLNDSPLGSPTSPAPAVPGSADLIDRVSYGRGEEYGYTNGYGSWLSLTDGAGNSFSYERDAANRLTRAIGPAGSCAEYSYDELGNTLSAAQMPAAQCVLPPAERDQGQIAAWSYSYESRFNQIKTVTDPRGNVTTYTYDYELGEGERGLLARVSYPTVSNEQGQLVTPTVSYSYNALGLIETRRDRRGMLTRYHYTQGTADEAAGGANARFLPGVTPVPGLLVAVIVDDEGARLTTSYSGFDGRGNPGLVVDPDGRNATSYTYDAVGRATSTTSADGIVTQYIYDSAGRLIRQVKDFTADDLVGRNIITSYVYDAVGRLIESVTEADGLKFRSARYYDINGMLAAEEDSLGNRTVYHYDDADRLIRLVDPTGATTSFSYTPEGRLASETDPEGSVTSYEYDAQGRALRELRDAGGLNLETTFSYDSAGNLLRRTSPEGVTCYAYDSNNRQTQETSDCRQGGLNLSTSYHYDSAGTLAAITDPRGTTTTHSHDALGRRLRSTIDAGGLSLSTRYDYDAAGNLYQVVDEQRGSVTRYSYDQRNRVVQSCVDASDDPATGLNLCTSYGYDRLGYQESVTDPRGIVTRTINNAFGLPVALIKDASGRAVTTRIDYDDALRRVGLTDANGNATGYSYTARGEVARETFADGNSVAFRYDGRGNLVELTTRDGQSIAISYDGAARRTDVQLPGGLRHYEYDGAGRVVLAQESANGHSSELRYAYDPVGSVISSTQTLDGISYSVGFTPDYLGGQLTISYPSGIQRLREHDRAERLVAVREAAGGAAIAAYSYDDAQGLVQIARSNGLADRVAHDRAGRISQVSVSGGAGALADYRYGYDAGGNRSFMQRAHEPGQPFEVYAYDSLNQLSEVWYGADAPAPGAIGSFGRHVQYSLDNLGNRLMVSDSTAGGEQYQPADGDPLNRYQRVGDAQLAYDQRGNLLDDGLNSYSYDILNRQVGVSGPGGSASYIYDAFGQRIASLVGGSLTRYVYDAEGQIIEEYDGGGALLARYTYGEDLDRPLTIERGGQTYSYHRDGLGSISEISDAGGTIIERYSYDVYGRPTISDGAGNPLAASAIGNRLMFTGREYDAESGNYYLRARMYSPALGRFMQLDPLGDIDGPNRYAYVGNRPTVDIDPLGLFSLEAGVKYELSLDPDWLKEQFGTGGRIAGVVKRALNRFALDLSVKLSVGASLPEECCNEQRGTTERWWKGGVELQVSLGWERGFESDGSATKANEVDFNDSGPLRRKGVGELGGDRSNPRNRTCPTESGCAGKLELGFKAEAGLYFGAAAQGTLELYPDFGSLSGSLKGTVGTVGVGLELFVKGSLTCYARAGESVDLFDF